MIPKIGEVYIHHRKKTRYIVSHVGCKFGFKLNGTWIFDNPIIEYYQEGFPDTTYGRFVGDFQRAFTKEV